MATKQNATASSYKYEKWTPDKETTALKEKADSFGSYTESERVSELLGKKNDYEANNNPGEWQGGNYQDAVKSAWDAINNRAKFSYDLNGDALYQQYKDKYINQGRLAMADTIGQASAMTGGYGNSYAVTAGSQAYQSHLQNLNDIVPQLYQMAYDRYNQEGQDLKDKYSLASDMYNREYGEHRDKVSDYNTNLDRLASEYYNERNFDYGSWDADRNYYMDAYNNQYNRDYGAHTDEQNRLYQQYRDRVADEQWQASYDLQQKSYNLQEKAAQTEKSFGLTFAESEKLKELAAEEDWDNIDNYIMSLDCSDEKKKELASYWLPESYLNPAALANLTTPNPVYRVDKNTYATMK
jgi:hypothetical protein